MFGFVAYQLWGTGLEYAQAQDRLDDEFEQLIAASPVVTTTTPPTTAATTSTVLPPAIEPAPATAVAPTTEPAPVLAVPDFAGGDVMARIEVTSIGLDAKVVSGVQPNDLKAGPGHYPDTPMPGQLGNAAIAGHRTTYGQPFFRVDEISAGEEIVLTTVQGRFVYRMTSSEIVGAGRSDVVATTDPTVARLTLTTCHPRYTAAQRLIVFADLDEEASSAAAQQPIIDTDGRASQSLPPGTLPGEPVASAPTTSAPATTAPGSATSGTTVDSTQPPASPGPDVGEIGAIGEQTADAFSHGWFSDDAAFGQVALWGLVLTALGLGAYLLSRRVRRNWVGALAGVVPFVVVLYFFFQNVNRLLPAAL